MATLGHAATSSDFVILGEGEVPAAPPRRPSGGSPASEMTALEHACLQLKVPHPDLPRWLYDLIVEARRMDAAMLAMLVVPHSRETFPQDVAAGYIAAVVKPDPEIRP